jgi:RHS repeat-associated protein
MKKFFNFKKIIRNFIILGVLLSFNLTTLLPSFLMPFGPRMVSANCSSTQATPASSGLKQRVGGVALDQAAKFLADMSDITGAYYDANLDRIVFVGKKNISAPKFDKDDLAVAIKVIVFEGKLPWFSLEDNSNDENLLDAVYATKTMVDTKFGKVFLDADYQMKKYSKGRDENDQVINSSVPGYKSFDQMYLEYGPSPDHLISSSRWWITPEYISLKRDDAASAFIFDQVKMQVKTEVLYSNNDPNWNRAAEDFARHQTEHFDEFANEVSSYREIKQLGKIAAVVKWIFDSGIATDFHWAREYTPKIVSTPRVVPKLPPTNYSVQGDGYTISGSITGGAELFTPNDYATDTLGESSTIKNSAQSVPTTKEDINWQFTKDGIQYEAVAVTADAFRSLGSYNAASADLSIPASGEHDLAFTRAYSSFSGVQDGVGRGWSIFPAKLMDTKPWWVMNCSGTHPASLGFQSQSGGWESFIYNCTNGYMPEDPAYHSKITHNSDGSFTVTIMDQSQYIFDSSYKLKSVKDKVGATISYNYDGSGKLTGISDSQNHSLIVSYNPQGWISQVADWSGRKTTYSYDEQGNLLTATDPKGNITTYTYDANFKLISAKNRLGNVAVTNTYTPEAKIATQKNAVDLTATYTHDDTTKTITTADNLGRTSKTIYDAKGRKLEETDPLLKNVKYTYGVEFAPLTVTDKRGNKITNTYDANGNLTSVTYPDTRKITYEYDAQNRLTKSTDSRYSTFSPKVITYSYDAAGNLSQMTEPNTTISKFTYDPYGEMLTLTDPLTKVTTWTRDSFGNALSEKDPNLNVTNYEYDSIGRLTKKTDAEGKVFTYTYDGNGNVLTQTDAAGTTTNVYDKENRPTQITLPNSTVTKFSYNTTGSLTSVIDAMNQVTNYGYDTYQNLTSQIDALGKTTSYIYDKLNRQTESKTPLGKIAKLEYDANGNITKRTDANGSITTYIYDTFNRLTKITYPDTKTIAFTYDNRGNMTQMVDPMGTSTFTYDEFDRRTSAKNPHGHTIGYNYDKVGDMTKLTNPGSYAVIYGYDNAHRLTSVKDWNLLETKYGYLKNNLVVTRTYPNGILTTYGYDGANRLAAIDHKKSTTTLANFAYVRDAVGNITKETSQGSFIPSPNPTSSPSPTPVPLPTASPNPNGPDLVITTLALNPVSPNTDSELTPRVTVKNQGVAAVTDKLIRFAVWLDLDKLPNYKTPYMVFDEISVTLAPGESKTYPVDSMNTDRLGSHSLWAIVDQGNVLGESNENNNAAGPFNFTVAAAGTATPTQIPSPSATPTPVPTTSPTPTATPLVTPTPISSPTPAPSPASGPDLTITNSVPSKTNPAVGESISLTTYIKNQGTTALTSSNYIYTGYYYDRATAPTTSTSYDSQSILIQSINPGVTATTTKSNIAFSTAGQHNIWVLVDRNGSITETNETNNIYGPITITVGTQASAPSFLQNALTFFDSVLVRTASAQTLPVLSIRSFTYDPLNRLTKSVYPDNGVYSYTYDKIGNRLTQADPKKVHTAYYYDNDSKLSQTDTDIYIYDNSGNLIRQKPPLHLDDILYAYDFENRLTTYTAANNLKYSYKYDGLGNLLQMHFYNYTDPNEGDPDRRFVVDNSGPLSRTVASIFTTTNGVNEIYVYGQGLISVGSKDISSDRKYLLEDGLGNIRFTTNSSGSKRDQMDFDPFGNLYKSPFFGDSSFQFKGEYTHDATGLVFMRARWYDPITGRFISRDPIRGALTLPQTQNPYAFAVNNPANVSDPSGKFIETAWDVANLAYDVATFNPCDPWSYASTGYDALSVVVPFLPAGATKVVTAGKVLKGAQNPAVQEAAEYGKMMHKTYEYPAGYAKEVTLESGKRVDALNEDLRHVIELKPDNPSAVQKGEKQVQGYVDELNQTTGGGWTGEVWTYSKP